MAMRALRDGASKGVLKFFLLGLLALAAGGLVFTDVGGFFRGGSIGSTNVAKIGSKTISLAEFNGALSSILRSIGMSPQEAYARGYIKEFLIQKINDSVIIQTATKSGIEIEDERTAQKIKALIAPEIAAGGNPKQILQQRLSSLNMSEKQFVETLKNSMKAEPLITALQSTNTLSNFVVEDIQRFQAEKRNIQFVTLKNSEIAIDTPDESNLTTLYEISKEDYAIPETRIFNLIEATYEAKSEKLNEDEILEEKYALADIIDDLAASGASSKEIAEQTGSKITTTKAVSLLDIELDRKIIEEGFSLEQGEISPVFETKDGQFIAVELVSINEKSYKPYESVKEDLKKKWIADQQKIENKIRALSLVGEINKGEKKLSNIGTLQTFDNLQRTSQPSKPLDSNTLDSLFRAKINEAIAFPTEDGMGIAQVTKIDITANPTAEDKEKILQNLKQASSNESLMLYLNHNRSQMNIKTNEGLIERAYNTPPAE